MQPNTSSLIEQTKIILQTQALYRRNYETQLAPAFVPIEYFDPNEPDLSRVLARLLNPRGSHAQGTLFLDAFLDLLQERPESLSFKDDQNDSTARVEIPRLTTQTSVSVEYPLRGGQDRLDILLTNSTTGGLIVIENKPWAGDGEEQLERYARWALTQHKYKTAIVVLLCDREPTEYSIKKESNLRRYIVRIGYSDLARCLRQAACRALAPNVRYFVESFALYLLKNVAGEKTMTDRTLLNLLAKPENLAAVKEIHDSYPELLKDAWDKLCKTLEIQCQKKYKDTLTFQHSTKDQAPSRYIYLSFRPSGENQSWAVSFECSSANLGDFCWGADLDNPDSHPKNDNLRKSIREHFEAQGCGSGNSSHWWPWWVWGNSNADANAVENPDIPRDLKDPQWLEQMLAEGQETVLTKAIWARVEAIFPPKQNEKWPKF